MSLRSRYLFLAIALLFAAVFVRLGVWQLSRLGERRRANAAAAAQRALPEVDLNRTGGVGSGGLDNRRLAARGTYDRTFEVVLRGRLYREVPGVHVVTPLKVDGSDHAILVLRGYAPSPDAMTADLDSLVEPGTVEVRGVGMPVPALADSGAPLAHNGKETWRRLDLPALRARIPYPIHDVYLQQAPDSGLPRYPRRIELPALNDGPHLSYAIQWLGFAIVTLTGATLFVLRKGR